MRVNGRTCGCDVMCHLVLNRLLWVVWLYNQRELSHNGFKGVGGLLRKDSEVCGRLTGSNSIHL